MISAIGKRTERNEHGQRSGGFTLLEMLIVLGILALFAGFFTLRFDDSNEEEALTKASSQLKKAVMLVKNRSSTYRLDQYIVLSPNFFESRDSLPAGKATASSNSEGRIPLPTGVLLEWLPHREDKWQSGSDGFLWRFRSSGLNDPLSVRLSINGSYTELRFDVLTGNAEESTILK